MIVGRKKMLSHSLSGIWHVDKNFAISEFARYQETLMLIKSGIITAEDTAKEPTSLSNVVPLKGTMMVEDSWCDYGALSVVEQLNQLDSNPDIPYVVMDVNSGGGMSQAGYLVRDAISSMSKPVYAYVIEAGSAALNAISTCSKIFLANESSQIGSIGSYYSINKKAVEEYMATFDEIYASQSEDKNGAIRAYFKGDNSLLIQDASNSAAMFIESISKTRNIPIDSPVMSGGMYSGHEAIKYGLADAIVGTLNNVENHIVSTNSINQNQNNSSMKGIITALNRIFGWSLKEDSTEAVVVEQLTAQDTIANTITSAVTAQITGLAETVNKFSAENSKLQASFDSLQAEFTALKATHTSLETESAKSNAAKELLEKEILELKTKRDGQLSNDVQTVESEFLGTLKTYKISIEVPDKK